MKKEEKIKEMMSTGSIAKQNKSVKMVTFSLYSEVFHHDCEPPWFLKLDVLGPDLSDIGLKSWGAWWKVQMLHSSKRHSRFWVFSWSVDAGCVKGGVYGEIVSQTPLTGSVCFLLVFFQCIVVAWPPFRSFWEESSCRLSVSMGWGEFRIFLRVKWRMFCCQNS